MGSISFQRERFRSAFPELLPLFARQARELNAYPDIKLNVDRVLYEHADAVDGLRVFTARDRGRIVAYAMFIVDTNPHYCQSKQAKQDVFYVDPDRRGGLLGHRLIKYADAVFTMEGVQVVYHHVKLAHPTLGKLLALNGYGAIETIWGKRLDLTTPRESGGEDANNAHAAAIAVEA